MPDQRASAVFFMWFKRWFDQSPQALFHFAFNIGIVLLGLVLVQGVTALSPIIIARQVPPTEFGQFMACTSLLSLFAAFPNFGLEHWLLAQGGATHPQIGALWRGAFKLRLLSLGVWAMVMIALGTLLPHGTYPFFLFTFTIFWLVVDSLAYPCFSALRLLNQHHAVTMLQALTALGTLITLLILPADPIYLITFAVLRFFIEFVGTSLVTGFTWVHLRVYETPWSLTQVFQATKPFMIGEIAFLIYSRSDSAILSLISGKDVMAIYGPASSIITMTFIVGAALYYFVLPILGRAYAQGNHAKFWRIGMLQLIIQAILGLGIMLGVILVSPFVIRYLFGNAYALAIPVLQLMSPVIFLKFLNFGLASMLTGSQNQNTRTRVQVFLALLNVITTGIGTIGWQVSGAILADVLTELCLFGGYAWTVSILRRT